MYCPFCNAHETKVVDSRLIADGAQVRRRRQCIDCLERFTTFESAELIMPQVKKRDNRREQFNIDKLRAGILRALEKRPVSADSVEKSIVNITQKLRSLGEREIDSNVIGELVMEELHSLDDVAYVRFASVYKRFKDISEFKKAIDELK